MLVSVYLPTHNRLALLKAAVASVLAQTYREIELLIVDDASSDGTQDYLRALAREEPRVAVQRIPEPLGAPAARNLAIQAARGDFVTGLDDDDTFVPERIAAFVEYWRLLTSMGQTPSCLYAQDILRVDGKDAGTTRKLSAATADDLLEANCIGNQIFAPRAHFLDAGLFDPALPAWQDLEFFMRVLKRFGPGHLLDMPTYVFNIATRRERISTQTAKVRRAFEIVERRHAGGVARSRQKLFLQMFKDYYGTKPTLSDWVTFMRWGMWPHGIRELMRAMF